MQALPGVMPALALLVLAAALAVVSSTRLAARASAATGTSGSLSGTVSAAGKALAGAHVILFAGERTGSIRLGAATANPVGQFEIRYEPPASGVLYVAASPGGAGNGAGRLQLLSVAGVLGNAGGVAPQRLSSVTVDELTTVATTFALAQFITAGEISGPSPGLENAGSTVFNLVSPVDGKAGAVVTNANNGSSNQTLATLDTLANLVSVCSAAPSSAQCRRVLSLSTAPGAAIPTNTVQAVLNLVKSPTVSRAALFLLARTQSLYAPSLGAPPKAWILALHYTEAGLYAPGRSVLDAKGDVWSGNNWQPGTVEPSTEATALNPVGGPAFGTPISGGGVKGPAWGTAVAANGSVWFANFAGNSVTELSATGAPLSPNSGWTNGGLKEPQGVAVDQKGDIWIANSFGTETAPGEGDVVVYPGGDPSKAIKITGGGINHPFAIQIDGHGDAWVTNAGLGGAKLVGTKAAPLIGKFSGSVTVIGPNFKPESDSPIESSSFKFPLGLAIDFEGNAWVPSYFGNTVTEIHPRGTVAGVFKLPGRNTPWSVAIDGAGRVWVANFLVPGVELLCGAEKSACPPGSSTGEVLSPRPYGFRSESMQHLTSVQIDQSGNVWLSNNWAKIAKPPVGGDGVVELIGAAVPVCTPMVGLPAKPSTATPGSCPNTTIKEATTSNTITNPDPAARPSGGSDTWVWIGLVILAAAGAGVLLARRQR